MAEVKSTKKDQPMLDPIAYRSDYREDDIIGPDEGGVMLTDKYQGEGTNNVYSPYNDSITTDQLDPNYQYGQPAKDINRIDDSYITRRNDQIASALYNEGKLTKDDVIAFLQGQQNWYNSTDNDRAATIENVWNRLGQLSNENKKEENVDTSNMENTINRDTSGTIYGKTTADTGNPAEGIKTLNDAKSVYNIMNASRLANYKGINFMDSRDIAASIFTGTIPYGEQAYADLQEFNMPKYLEVQNYLKELQGQDVINAISSGSYDYTTIAEKNDTSSSTVNYAVNNASLSVSATQLLKSIDSILSSNEGATTAEATMDSLAADMEKLKNRMLNLRKEANTVFKGDVPDYIVNAYINNRSQEIQNQLSILEGRYNAAYDRYKTELSHAERQAEYDLKKDAQELERWKAKNTSTSSSTSSSQDGRMRTERNNNPTAMTTDYAKMMGLELGVDYEIGDSFIGGDGRTYYTARFLGDPVETAIKAFDRGAANNVFANEGGVLGHWHLGISNQKWLSMTDKEKREVIDKILQKEGGKMDNMSYYLNNTSNEDEKVTYNPAWEDMLRQIATGQVKLNSATAKSYAEMMGTDVRGLGKMVESYQADQLANGKAAGKDLLNIMAELQILFEDKGLDDGQFDTNAWQSLGWGAIGRKHDQLKEQLKLNKVTEARDKGATFGQMTEYEWKVLENAATSLNILKQNDKEYTDEFKKIMRATWIATFGKVPTEQEWQDYVKQQRAYQSFNISGGTSGQSEDDKLAQIGSGNVGTGIDFGAVVTNGR